MKRHLATIFSVLGCCALFVAVGHAGLPRIATRDHAFRGQLIAAAESTSTSTGIGTDLVIVHQVMPTAQTVILPQTPQLIVQPAFVTDEAVRHTEPSPLPFSTSEALFDRAR